MENLLFLAHRIPYPPNKGDKIRSFNFLKHLTTKYKVYLGTFIDDDHDLQYTSKLDEICEECHYENLNPFVSKVKSLQGLLKNQPLSLPYYGNKSMQAWVNKTIELHKIKKFLIFSSVMAQFINNQQADNMVIDFVDVDSDKWRQYSENKKGLSRWIYHRESKYLLDYEKLMADRAKMSFFVSEQEADLFKSLAPQVANKVTNVNNGVDTDYFDPTQIFPSPFQQEGDDAFDTFVFTGAMDYWANVDAVKWFAQEVFIKLQEINPKIKFYIVGSKPTSEVRDLSQNKNIIVTGAVDDVRPYVAHATFVVTPLRIARGIQNKVLEAMSMSKHVIATSAAMEGIPYHDNMAVSVSDESADMIRQIKSLLDSRPVDVLTNANREFVKEKFSWQQNVNRLSALL
jgi:sugar transferase (PEP-CTERM/EpsH1 system associated)